MTGSSGMFPPLAGIPDGDAAADRREQITVEWQRRAADRCDAARRWLDDHPSHSDPQSPAGQLWTIRRQVETDLASDVGQLSDVDRAGLHARAERLRDDAWADVAQLLDDSDDGRRALTASEQRRFDSRIRLTDDAAAVVDELAPLRQLVHNEWALPALWAADDRLADLDRQLDAATDPAELARLADHIETAAAERDTARVAVYDPRNGTNMPTATATAPASVPSDYRTTDEFRRFIRSGDPAELRALGASSDAAGGYTVPEGFRRRLVARLAEFGAVRRVAEIIVTDSGVDLPYPTVDETATTGFIVAENTQITEQDATFGQRKLAAYMYSSGVVRASFQLLEDSAFDLEAWLARALAARIGRAESAHFTTGTGTAQPEGLLTNVTVAVTGAAGQTDSVGYDDLVDLAHAVDPAYREPGDSAVGWMFNDTTYAALRKLKDGQDRPLLEPDIQGAAPNLLLGHRIHINNDMPGMAASAKSIVFGNLAAGYVIRDVRSGYRLLVLRERYGDYAQVGYLGFARADGGPQDLNAYAAYQNAAA